MKKSHVLFKQHIGWHFYKNWVVQGKRKPLQTGAEAALKSKGIKVLNPDDFLKEKRTFEKVEVIGYKDKPLPLDNTHPDWHDKPLLSFKDHNVLLEGIVQAKIITNCVEFENASKVFGKSELPKDVDRLTKDIILNSHLFDAEQVKLPKIKDESRPAWNFPRVYGISQERRNKLIIKKLLNQIECITDKQLTKERYIYERLLFSYPFERNENLAQLEVCGDTVVASTKPLSPITNEPTDKYDLPDISPIDMFITFNKENIYKINDIYPIKPTVKPFHPHTIFIHFDREFVKNIFEEEVTEQQIFGRSLLKSFAVAASYARQKFGKEVKVLEEPVTLQCVQTDGHFFHLGVLQLNTLDLESKHIKNVWYQTPLQYLFETCKYINGRPTLEGYNNEIIRQLHYLYNRV